MKETKGIKMGKCKVVFSFPYGEGRSITREEAPKYKGIFKIPKSSSIKKQIAEINKRAMEIVESERSREKKTKDFQLD